MNVAHLSSDPSPEQPRWGLPFAGIVLLLAGAGVFYFGWKGSEDARASESWPLASGIVVSSEVQVTPDSEGSDDYDADVQVVYVVDDVQHQTSRVSFGIHNSADRGAAERTVARYPVGGTVEVAYDPADPGRGVLEPGNEGWNSWVRIAGVITALIGLAFLLVPPLLARRRRKRRQRASMPPSTDPSAQPFIR